MNFACTVEKYNFCTVIAFRVTEYFAVIIQLQHCPLVNIVSITMHLNSMAVKTSLRRQLLI